GVKEASGDIVQVAELARLTGDRLAIWSGNDDQVIPIMSLGGRGVISVLGNVAPRQTSRMARAWLDGDLTTAVSLQLDFLPLARALFAEPNPIPVKTAVRWLGFDAGPLRQPLCEADPARQEVVVRELERLGLRRRISASP
ncbi:MAG: dihydrodipicolinate synthase family protein, partial [Longimicrobiales bacterium]